MRCNSITFFDALKKKNIDFVAIAMTPWHAIGIDAFLFEKSKNYKKKIKGLVLILEHDNKYMLHENNFYCKNFADVDFYFIENLYNKRFINIFLDIIHETINIIRGIIKSRESAAKQKKLYLISPFIPYLPFIEYFKDDNIAKFYKPTFVVVDEGVGTYLSNRSKKISMKHASGFSILAETKLKIYANIEKFLRKIALRYVSLDERHVYNYNSSLEKNENIVNRYKKIIRLRSNDLGLDKNRYALIITAPLSEHKMISKKLEKSVIHDIIQVFDKNNIEVLIKPHPNESKDKYNYLKKSNVKIIRGDFPVEEIIPHLNPLCIIGTLSTALINSKLMFNIDAISIVNLLKTDNELMEYTIQDFKELCKNFIYFLDSINELIDILNLNSDYKSEA